MKKFLNIILIALSLLVCISLLLIPNNVLAETGKIDTNEYKPERPTKEEAGESIQVVGEILGTLRNVGVILSVIGLSLLGLKYMLASPSEKVNYVKAMLPYIVGCVLLMFSVVIVEALFSIAYSPPPHGIGNLLPK